MLKKILFPALSVFLIYQSYHLVLHLLSRKELSFQWWQQLIFALLLNLFITGIFAFVGFVFSTGRLLPASYYTVHRAKLIKSGYRLLGVSYFKRFLLILFWGRKNNRKRYFSGSREGLSAFDYQTRQSEFGHLAALGVITVVACALFSVNNTGLFVFTMLINIIGNFYPVLLQRMHRVHIARLMRLQQRPALTTPENS